MLNTQVLKVKNLQTKQTIWVKVKTLEDEVIKHTGKLTYSCHLAMACALLDPGLPLSV